MMYQAREPQTNGRTWQFKTLDGLARRITGSKNGTYTIDRDGGVFRPPHYSVRILTPSRGTGWNVITRVLVPTEALEDEDLGLIRR